MGRCLVTLDFNNLGTRVQVSNPQILYHFNILKETHRHYDIDESSRQRCQFLYDDN